MKAWEALDYNKKVLQRDKALGSIPLEKINIVGSSASVGHPFAANGARITWKLSRILLENSRQRGLISICTAGGMGVTAILKSV